MITLQNRKISHCLVKDLHARLRSITERKSFKCYKYLCCRCTRPRPRLIDAMSEVRKKPLAAVLNGKTRKDDAFPSSPHPSPTRSTFRRSRPSSGQSARRNSGSTSGTFSTRFYRWPRRQTSSSRCTRTTRRCRPSAGSAALCAASTTSGG